MPGLYFNRYRNQITARKRKYVATGRNVNVADAAEYKRNEAKRTDQPTQIMIKTHLLPDALLPTSFCKFYDSLSIAREKRLTLDFEKTIVFIFNFFFKFYRMSRKT